MPKQSFTCQTPKCGQRRTYERVGDSIIVDACEGCGARADILEVPAT